MKFAEGLVEFEAGSIKNRLNCVGVGEDVVVVDVDVTVNVEVEFTVWIVWTSGLAAMRH